MKKLNILFSFILLIMLLSACEKDDDPNYAELLKGTWVSTMINEQAVLTDASFVMEFRSDNTKLDAIGIQLNENNKSWQETSSNTYIISGDMIIIDATDDLGNACHKEFKIQALDNESLTYTVPIFSTNGEVSPDENTYTCKKVTNDYSTDFTGVWYGRCTTQGSADSLFHYWEYFDDGTYNYYYQDENSKWIKNSDNGGGYFLYGQLMATNYHDILSEGPGRTFECWNFTIDGNIMKWTGLRENNVIISFEMEKVLSAPENGE